MMCRLAFLVIPKPELLRALDASGGQEICRLTSVITPVRDYEHAFEGWKRAWMAKAKQDFVAEFVLIWSDEFPEFTAQLQVADSFDHWWSLSEIDVVEINSAWKPS